MSLEWRDGRFIQVTTDDDLENWVVRSEQQKADPPKSKYDAIVGVGLSLLACLSFWAFFTWLILLWWNR
jgi:hypothetical protein